MNRENAPEVLAQLQPTDEYILQEYVNHPMLWHGKKFHFRCYTLIRGDLSAYVYSNAFVLTAGHAYDTSPGADVHKHITNLSVNKRIEGHPGQIVFDF